MAAFTTLALIGLAAAAGGLATKKALSSDGAVGDQTGGDASKGPHANIGGKPDAPPGAPPSLALTAGSDALAASTAAARQKKRAGVGANLLNGPTVNQAGTAAVGQPKSLLGY